MNEIFQNLGFTALVKKQNNKTKTLKAKIRFRKPWIFLLDGIVSAEYSMCICYICIQIRICLKIWCSQDFRSNHKVLLINLVSSVPCPWEGHVLSSPGWAVGTGSHQAAAHWVYFLSVRSPFLLLVFAISSFSFHFSQPDFYAFSFLQLDLTFFIFLGKIPLSYAISDTYRASYD